MSDVFDELERQLRETLQRYSGATVLVSHNLEELFRVCGEFVVLEAGSVIAQGGREAVFERDGLGSIPRRLGVSEVLCSDPLPRGESVERRLNGLHSEVEHGSSSASDLPCPRRRGVPAPPVVTATKSATQRGT